MFFNLYRNKTVLITGHSGFKGAWLCAWLQRLGARVVGLSRDIPTKPSFFEACQLSSHIETHWGDVRHKDFVSQIVEQISPDFIFHLAAQALVRKAYEEPTETFETNVLGTLYLLEAARRLKKQCSIVLITSDKAYDNVEWTWGYRENDRLGGKDPYSASKGAAELIIRSYVQSFFNAPESSVRLAVTRAGNVIGGGDWAIDRIVPDIARAWADGQVAQIRNPAATRPWQHVLEPLSGYLLLGARLATDHKYHGEAFNFGPKAENNFCVADLIQEISKSWPGGAWNDGSLKNQAHEAQLLKLNCDKALHLLGWQPTLSFSETAKLTAEWYREYYAAPELISKVSERQIDWYEQLARERSQVWCR